MSKIQLPPKRQTETIKEEKPLSKISEQKIQAIINKGGSPIQNAITDEDKLKNFNILVLESDLKIIGELCDKRPQEAGKNYRFFEKGLANGGGTGENR